MVVINEYKSGCDWFCFVELSSFGLLLHRTNHNGEWWDAWIEAWDESHVEPDE